MHSAMAIRFFSLLTIASSVSASNVWTVNCAALSVQRTDPIVSPGQISSHVHAIAGGTAFGKTMDAHAAVNAAATTCDKFTDHSNYWCPQLYQMKNGMFEIVKFTGANSYYTNFTCDYHPSGKCDTPRNAHAFPPGFRMIAGDAEMRTMPTGPNKDTVLFTSGNQKNVNGIPTVLGDNFQAAVRFPSCWDGVNVDSADHKSHVAYPDPKLGGDTTGGMCPKSHPVALIAVGTEFGFDIRGVSDPKSLVFSNGDTTGFGFHGDFLQGWTNSAALEKSFSNCFDNNNCPWRAFGTPDGKPSNPQQRTPQVAALPDVEIGLNGPISKLPGDNPVFKAGGSVPTRTAIQSLPASTFTTKTKTKTTSSSFVAATCPPGCAPISNQHPLNG